MASYKKACFTICQFSFLVLSAIPLRIHGIQWPLLRVSGCTNRIPPTYHDGAQVDAGDFSWQVKLKSLAALRCSGVLIARQWVLTAASCFDGNYQPRNWNVDLAPPDTSLSADDVSSNVTTGESVLVDSLFLYGAYRLGQTEHNIALVRLHPNDATQHHQPACLIGDHDDFRNLSCISVGWGSGGVGEPPAPTVRRWVVNGSDGCGRITTGQLEGEHRVCARPLGIGNTQSCTGDTGAPLICNFPDGWKVTGVVSQAAGCGSITPREFPSVRFYLSFLNKLMAMSDNRYFVTPTSATYPLTNGGTYLTTDRALIG